MSLARFYLEPEKWTAEPLLDAEKTRHLKAFRLSQGAELTLLNGQGLAARCRILSLDKHQARLEILEEKFTPKGDSLAIIALAQSKAVRRGFFLEKAVELNASEIWLWQAENSQGRLSENTAQAALGQLIAGLKQCGNPWLPKLKSFAGIEPLIKESISFEQRILPWEAQAALPLLSFAELGLPGTSIYVIGPEGGFSLGELARLKAAAFQAVSLGPLVLRCETAATLCLGLHSWAAQIRQGKPETAAISAPECALAPAQEHRQAVKVQGNA